MSEIWRQTGYYTNERFSHKYNKYFCLYLYGSKAIRLSKRRKWLPKYGLADKFLEDIYTFSKNHFNTNIPTYNQYMSCLPLVVPIKHAFFFPDLTMRYKMEHCFPKEHFLEKFIKPDILPTAHRI